MNRSTYRQTVSNSCKGADIESSSHSANRHHVVEAAPVSMTSREIAELTGKTHDNVLRDVRAMLAELEGGVLRFEETRRDPQNGQSYPVFVLPKRETLILVSGYSVALRARIIDRWQELEAAQAPVFQVPTTLSGTLRLAAEQAEQIEAQATEIKAKEARLALAAPKEQFVDNYVMSTGNKGFREVCKLLRANEREFGQWLDDTGITYRLAGERTAHQHHVNAGRFVTKAGTTGEGGHAYNQLKFTPKGVAWIAGEWAKHQIQGQGGVQ